MRIPCGAPETAARIDDSRPRRSAGVGYALGTFGELLQGMLPRTPADFLVTLPIVRGSTVRFRYDPHARDIRVTPAHRRKSARLATDMLAHYGLPGGGVLAIESTLPEGKGQASSSADLVATARAVAMAVGVVASPGTIELLMRRIEPSDGLMYPGVVAFYHREVRLLALLGAPPPLTLVGVDEGGEVDTVRFNRIPKPYTDDERREYGQLLDAVSVAVRVGDVRTIGSIASRSANLSQKMRRRPLLEDMLRISRSVGGLGVVAAHSGTVLGVLLCGEDPAHARRERDAIRACESICDNVWADRVCTGGGVRSDSGTALPTRP